MRYRGTGIMNEYQYILNDKLRILNFSKMTEEWLDFIVSCRLGQPHDYDIVEGPTHQISFHTPLALKTLTFQKGYEVHGEE